MVVPKPAQGKINYQGMVDEIGIFLHESLGHYKEGNKLKAKLKVQAAYFEIFENLEGPIRINVSARKNYELEEEFTGIRKMIVKGEPIGAIEERIDHLMSELNKVVGELEGGYELVAEAPDEIKQPTIQQSGEREKIHPVWLQAVEIIQDKLKKSLRAYKSGDSPKAKELVIQSQFDGYKNTLMETAIRREVSQKKDYLNNSAFSEIIGMISENTPPEKIDRRISSLIEGLKSDLTGLSLMEGIVTTEVVDKEISNKDWSGITGNLFVEIEKAIDVYEKGKTKEATGLVQDAYFDIFEASGMEAKIGARDAGFKARLEGHFSMIVGQMKKGDALGNIKITLAEMNGDFQKAVKMLTKEEDSPLVLFFYSLMIILREGVEAILIIMAITAYLVKTENKDKLGTIYNGTISALILSVITAILVKWVFDISTASQEVLEGVTMLLAAVVLFSVSYWLVSKAEAQKWISYIQGKVNNSISTGSLKALWFAAFLAVYREGAETVLFYQALTSDITTPSGLSAILVGFGVGSALLVAIYWIMKKGIMKLPIRQFFLVTGTLLYYMAFVFAGKGVMELIEGKVLTPSLISGIPTISFIGVYPYWQTLIPQGILIASAIAAYVVMAKQERAYAQEKSSN
jgi:high-affinity iron transporter